MAKPRLTTLHRMARESTLWAAWARVAAGSAIPGVDGVSVEAFGRNLGSRLDDLAQHLRQGTYVAQPLRPLNSTRGGVPRLRALPTVRDRVAQRAFLEASGARLESSAAEVSFAYRRGRSWLDALAQAERCRDLGLRAVLRADIANFFAEINHDVMLAGLGEVLGESSALSLVQGWIAAPLLTDNGLVSRPVGLPEGAAVSPALANVYLRNIDRAVHGRRGHLVRYADDLAVFCADESMALLARADLETALSQVRLHVNAAKTYVSSFETGFSFLGWVFFRNNGWPEEESKLGWTHPMSVGRPGRAPRGCRGVS